MTKSDLQRKLDKEKKKRQQEGGFTFIWNIMTKILPCEKFKTPFLERFLKTFNEIVSGRGAKVPVDAMIIANHRAKNLGDLFSIRNMEKNQPPQSHPTFDRLGGFLCNSP